MSSGFRYRSIVCLVRRGDERGVADADEARVREDLDDQPAVETEAGHRVFVVALACSIGSTRSIGLVQKCGCGGTVGPRHSTTRVRMSVIFTR